MAIGSNQVFYGLYKNIAVFSHHHVSFL